VVLGDGAGLGKMAFCYSLNLSSVTFEGAISQFDEAAFIGCEALKTLVFNPGITSIGPKAFEECWSLESVTLPEGLESIAWAAFQRCIGLQSVKIPESVIRSWGQVTDCFQKRSKTCPTDFVIVFFFP